LTSRLRYPTGHRLGDTGVANDSRIFDPEPGDPRDFRLVLLELGHPDLPERDAIRDSALFERGQAWQLALIRGDDDLAALSERQVLFLAERVHRSKSRPAGACLQ